MPPAVEAAIFDFDHTLAPLGDHVRWLDAASRMKERYRSLGVPESVLDGPGGSLVLYRRVADSGELPRNELIEVQRDVSQILAEFEAEAIPRTSLFPHVAQLADLGLPLGIVTSNSAHVVRPILQRSGLESAFEAIVGRDDVEDIKPSPEALLRCSRELGVPASHCVYVGDMTADMLAASAASMLAYGVLTGIATADELRSAGAHEVFEDLPAIRAALAAI